jgi:hypothetical protein
MMLKILAAVLGLPTLAFLVLLIWGGMFKSPAAEPIDASGSPVAVMSEQLSDGLIEAQVYLTGNLSYQIDIQFSPVEASTIAATMRPDVNLAMVDMHMDGYTLPLELIGAGAWRSKGKMPMAGLWVMSIGFGDEFADVTFDAK